MPPGEKSDKYHQVDLRDPYTRAEKCASCHVGNKAEGKFVTHEMYAAGHPPLPPFEVVTFAHDAPRHYHTHRENKALAAMPAEAAWKNFHFRTPADKEHPDGACPEARAFALGAVAGFDATMKLLADDAADTPKDQLLDFAHFDCYACHHDLKVPSWRQNARLPRGPRPANHETVVHRNRAGRHGPREGRQRVQDRGGNEGGRPGARGARGAEQAVRRPPVRRRGGDRQTGEGVGRPVSGAARRVE